MSSVSHNNNTHQEWELEPWWAQPLVCGHSVQPAWGFCLGLAQCPSGMQATAPSGAGTSEGPLLQPALSKRVITLTVLLPLAGCSLCQKLPPHPSLCFVGCCLYQKLPPHPSLSLVWLLFVPEAATTPFTKSCLVAVCARSCHHTLH